MSDRNEAGADPWILLNTHFRHHASLLERFRETGASDVLRMWETGVNESGHALSEFERHALIERYCELFGKWPEL